jgi:hypothetical protein
MIVNSSIGLAFGGMASFFIYSFVENIKHQNRQLIEELKEDKESLFRHQ